MCMNMALGIFCLKESLRLIGLSQTIPDNTNFGGMRIGGGSRSVRDG